jgi:hypothetical protein
MNGRFEKGFYLFNIINNFDNESKVSENVMFFEYACLEEN